MKTGIYFLSAVVFFMSFFSPVFCVGQTLPNAPAGSLVASAPDQPLKVLPGHRPAVMAQIQSVGGMDPSAQLSLAIGLSLHHPDELQTLVRGMRDPASTNYNHCLTREQFTEQFGPTKDEYQNAIAYAQAHGLTVTATYNNRLVFDVKGSVADIEKVFHVKLCLYPHPTEHRRFYAPDQEPSVDPDFSILDVSGLNNFSRPHSLDLKLRPLNQGDITTYSEAGSGPAGGLIGNDFRHAYVPGVTLNGYGQRIAIVSLTAYFPQDVELYEQLAGQANINITNISVNGFNTTPAPSLGTDDGETAGDIDLAASMAPAATIMVYEGKLMDDIFNQIAMMTPPGR